MGAALKPFAGVQKLCETGAVSIWPQADFARTGVR
jgi:hypothetical protein